MAQDTPNTKTKISRILKHTVLEYVRRNLEN